jgi:hypothetical protein
MCLMCEQDDMLASYREEMERRKAAREAAKNNPASATGASEDNDWMAGTWFAPKKADD